MNRTASGIPWSIKKEKKKENLMSHSVSLQTSVWLVSATHTVAYLMYCIFGLFAVLESTFTQILYINTVLWYL